MKTNFSITINLTSSLVMFLWLLLSICAPIVVNVRAAGEESIISSVKGTKIIPWIEVNSLDAVWVEPAIQGLEIWQEITDTAIVSTIPGKAVLYDMLRERLPGMRIIPGVKTSTLLQDDFDSLTGWSEIADEVRAVAETSGQSVVLLENETAIKPVMEGEQLIDLELLKQGLESLPQEIELIWYPGINGKNSIEQDRTAAVCVQVIAVCKVYFTNLEYAGRVPAATERWQRVGGMYDIIAPQATIPMLYFLGEGDDYYWQDHEIVEVLIKYNLKGWVIAYTGFSRWIEAAQNMAKFKDWFKSDLDGDGIVNIQDIQLCINVILGTQTNPEIVASADVNEDGQINVLDVQTIVNVILTQ